MSGSQNIIADVRRWYDTNGKRPVRNKIARAEDTLAKKWSKLIKDKLTLSDELLAEAEELQARLDSGNDPLEAWMYEYKRCPRRDRLVEGVLPQKWGRWKKRSSSPRLLAIQELMSTDPTWTEADESRECTDECIPARHL